MLVLVISKSKGISEILGDIRTSTYQICRIEEKINRITTFHKKIFNFTPEVRYMEDTVEKRRTCSLLLRRNYFSFPQDCVTCCKIFLLKQVSDFISR